MICPNCQKNLMDDALTCTECGHEFGPQNATQQFSLGETRASRFSGEARSTMSLGDETPMAVTKIASSREEMGITKVHVDTGMPQTKVSATQNMNATKLFGQPTKFKPFFGWLIVVEGKQPWQQFIIPLEDGRSTIGSGEDADFRIDDDGCERVHASLRVREGKLFVTDLDTHAGTLVHEELISRTELQDGDEIRIGSAVIRFRKL